MQKSLRAIFLLALIAAAWWGCRVLFPNPAKVIRSRLLDLAKTASFNRSEGNVHKIYALQKLPDFFATNLVVTADIPGHGTASLEGRDDLMQYAGAAREQWPGLKIEFVDLNVTLGSDKITATVDLTAKISWPGDRDFTPQEFNFSLKKVDGKWIIYKIQTVKTLTGLRSIDANGPKCPAAPPLQS